MTTHEKIAETNEHKHVSASVVDPDGMFERAYAEAAGVAHDASRPRAANPQTEARAIALKIAAGVIGNIDAEHVERFGTKVIATALAAKDAKLAEVRAAHQTYVGKLTIAEAQLAEANKALEPFARNIELIHLGAQDHDRLCDYGSQFNGTPTVGQARAARRALTGGQEDG